MDLNQILEIENKKHFPPHPALPYDVPSVFYRSYAAWLSTGQDMDYLGCSKLLGRVKHMMTSALRRPAAFSSLLVTDSFRHYFHGLASELVETFREADKRQIWDDLEGVAFQVTEIPGSSNVWKTPSITGGSHRYSLPT